MKIFTRLFIIILLSLGNFSFAQTDNVTTHYYQMSFGFSSFANDNIHKTVHNSKNTIFQYRYRIEGTRDYQLTFRASNANTKYTKEVDFISASTNLQLGNQWLFNINNKKKYGLYTNTSYLLNFFPNVDVNFLNWNLINSIGIAGRNDFFIANKPLTIEYQFPIFSFISSAKMKRFITQDETSNEKIFTSLGSINQILDVKLRAEYKMFNIKQFAAKSVLMIEATKIPQQSTDDLTYLGISLGVQINLLP
jgi:hypothetical protein